MKRVRLVDVAKEVGVSAKTVSNVVHGRGNVSEPVRQHVLAAIRDLGYRPNTSARLLRMGRVGFVGLALPTLAEPYFAQFAASFFDAAQAANLRILVVQTHGSPALERSLIDGEGLPAVDAMVISPLSLTAKDLQGRKTDIPLVFVGEHAETLPPQLIVHVGPNNVEAAETATDLLLKNQRQHIAVIGLQSLGSTATADLRFQGFRQAMKRANVPIQPGLMCSVGEFTRSEGARAMRQLLRKSMPFDAVFCFNDSMAIGAIYELTQAGCKVPKDIEVVGFDGLDEGLYHYPRFSTVALHPEESAHKIIELLSQNTPLVPGRYPIRWEFIRA
ncbi:MAG: LacI family DNA-binding transcriptional regulator [Actinomyces sp.]|nr:LacI family DNA-binding transcriptional regulator [Actinomyces sp.]